MRIILENKITKEHKILKTGFSYTTAFFGPLVPLYRQHWLYFVMLATLTCCGWLGILIVFYVCPFFINKHYLEFLLNNDWIVLNTTEVY